MAQVQRPINTKGVSTVSKGSKRTEASIGFGIDQFGLDDKLRAELDSKGLEAHFLSIKEIEKCGGFHPRGWRPYKREVQDSQNAFTFGRDPEGLVRRGDLVLGVKTKEEANTHRAYLSKEANSRKVQSTKQKADLQNYLNKNGIDSDLMRVSEDDDKSGD